MISWSMSNDRTMRERIVADVEIVGKLLAERDEQVLELLEEADVSPATVQMVKKHLAKDRRVSTSDRG